MLNRREEILEQHFFALSLRPTEVTGAGGKIVFLVSEQVAQHAQHLIKMKEKRRT